MNDISVLRAMQNSPGLLFRELGLEGDVRLYRSGLAKRSHSVSLDGLDDDIRNCGPAVITGQDGALIILMDRQSIVYECVAIAYDYVSGVFSLGLYSGKERAFSELSVRDAYQQGFRFPLSVVKQAVVASS